MDSRPQWNATDKQTAVYISCKWKPKGPWLVLYIPNFEISQISMQRECDRDVSLTWSYYILPIVCVLDLQGFHISGIVLRSLADFGTGLVEELSCMKHVGHRSVYRGATSASYCVSVLLPHAEGEQVESACLSKRRAICCVYSLPAELPERRYA